MVSIPYSQMWHRLSSQNKTALPSLHPSFTIPSPDGGNHTPAFTKAARTMEAHEACMTITKGIALNGLRLLCDDDFLQKVGAIDVHAVVPSVLTIA